MDGRHLLLLLLPVAVLILADLRRAWRAVDLNPGDDE
jgi:hypothetical protein